MTPIDYESLAYAKAATNPQLSELKAAIRSRLPGDADLAHVIARCLDNAYGQGFSEGALHVIQEASK